MVNSILSFCMCMQHAGQLDTQELFLLLKVRFKPRLALPDIRVSLGSIWRRQFSKYVRESFGKLIYVRARTNSVADGRDLTIVTITSHIRQNFKKVVAKWYRVLKIYSLPRERALTASPLRASIFLWKRANDLNYVEDGCELMAFKRNLSLLYVFLLKPLNIFFPFVFIVI